MEHSKCYWSSHREERPISGISEKGPSSSQTQPQLQQAPPLPNITILYPIYGNQVPSNSTFSCPIILVYGNKTTKGQDSGPIVILLYSTLESRNSQSKLHQNNSPTLLQTNRKKLKNTSFNKNEKTHNKKPWCNEKSNKVENSPIFMLPLAEAPWGEYCLHILTIKQDGGWEGLCRAFFKKQLLSLCTSLLKTFCNTDIHYHKEGLIVEDGRGDRSNDELCC